MVKPDTAPSSSASTPKTSTSTATPSFRDTNQSLQERLHTLLTRLSDTGKILETWPETKTDEDSTVQHTNTTTKLLTSIQKVVNGVKLVEEIVNGECETEIKAENGSTSTVKQPTALSNQLRQTPIPIDLLDMMDYGNGLNPDCFARGLIKESLRQLGNLQRRKASMKLLAAVIQNGMKEKERQLEILKSLDEKLGVGTAAGDNHVKKEVDRTMAIAIGEKYTDEINDNSIGKEKKRKREDVDNGGDEEPSSKR